MGVLFSVKFRKDKIHAKISESTVYLSFLQFHEYYVPYNIADVKKN